MRRLQFLIFVTLMSAVGCQVEKEGILSSEEIIKSGSVMQSSGIATCTVGFYKVSAPNTPYKLEDDAAVACNGHMASYNGSVYQVSFQISSLTPVLLTVVRPAAGAVSSEYLKF